METLNLYHGGLGKLTKAEKAERKRLYRIEKAEKKRLYYIEKAARKKLNLLMSKKERKRFARAEKKQQEVLKRATGFIGKLNKLGAARPPLTKEEEFFRQASIAGDFSVMNLVAPFGKTAWSPKTPIGKYRFVIQNGKQIYIPFSDADLERFISGPWFVRDPTTGLAPLVHPRRTRAIDLGRRANVYKKYQAKVLRKYPNTDIRHALNIYPGQYQISHGISSTWVKIREPVVIAVAIVAAVYLGPIIMEKVGGYLAGAGGGTGGATATATETATFVSKVKNAVTIYNKANTVAHIVQGKIPPPPIGITGGTFKEVAFNLVKQEIKSKAQDEAMNLGIKYVEKKMTEKEENKIKAEIAEMQKQMDALIPKGTPIMPALELPESERIKIAEIQVIQAKREQNNNAMLALAAGAGLFLLAG